jgi:hypothetical protein
MAIAATPPVGAGCPRRRKPPRRDPRASRACASANTSQSMSAQLMSKSSWPDGHPGRMKMNDGGGSLAAAAGLLGACEPIQVWRGSLAGDPGLVPVEPALRNRQIRGSRRAAAVTVVPREVGMDVVVERPGALDVHKASVTACVRVPDGGRREERIARVSTTVQGLWALRDWLAADRVTQVTMEATGVYWKPVWGHPGRRFRAAAGQCPSRQAAPGPQDRHLGRGVAVPAGRGRPAQGEPRAAQAGPRSARSHALSQGADPRSPARGQSAAQGHAGHRRQARLGRLEPARRVRPRDA